LDNLAVLSADFAHLPAGGEPVQQTLVARALARRGYDVSMVVADLGQPDGAVYDGVRTWRSFQPDAGIPVLRFIHPRWTSVMAALRRADADVYYTSCASTAVAQIVLAARRVGARTIFRIASDSDCDPARLLIRLWRDRKIYEYGLARVDAILAQSEFQRDAMARNYGRDSRIAGMLVEPGPPPAAFDARSRDALWVSNIRRVKRPDLLLELAGRLPRLSFEMVGGPLPGDEALYAQTARDAGNAGNLDFRGLVPYRMVSLAYARARVFVNTSDMEGFPNSFLQAWINGVPVVSFFDPDGVIRREGLGVAVGSMDEMQAAVQSLASDPGAWQAASERCLRFMKREFSEDKVLAPYLEALEHLGPRSAAGR
jgi:glycosyltransferase involved in cell wall biosynthesis